LELKPIPRVGPRKAEIKIHTGFNHNSFPASWTPPQHTMLLKHHGEKSSIVKTVRAIKIFRKRCEEGWQKSNNERPMEHRCFTRLLQGIMKAALRNISPTVQNRCRTAENIKRPREKNIPGPVA